MTVPQRVVVVGGGLAGFGAVQELRRRGYAGRLTLVDPQGVPYDRPPLSKEYLDGTLPADKLPFAPEAWFGENDVDLVVDAATCLDASGARVELAGGQALDADAVVLATGGRPRALSVPGGDAEGLLYLRTRADADRLRSSLVPGHRLVIVGAGLIGAEVAATASRFGADVTLIDPVEIPGVPAFGQAIARELHAMHAEHGVKTLLGVTTAIGRTASEWVVSLDEGTARGGGEVAADTVLISIGIVPHVELAAAAGLDVEGGVLVDAGQRSSNPAVWVVGDGARRRLPDGTLLRRHEHWEPALHSGQTAAAAILGQELPVHPTPWMWSDRYGVHVEGVGSMVDGHAIVRERDGRPWVVFQVDDDHRLLGAASIDGGMAIRAVRRMIDRGLAVDPAALADPSVDLKKLAK